MNTIDSQMERLDRMISLWKKHLSPVEFITMGYINICWKKKQDETDHFIKRGVQKSIGYWAALALPQP